MKTFLSTIVVISLLAAAYGQGGDNSTQSKCSQQCTNTQTCLSGGQCAENEYVKECEDKLGETPISVTKVGCTCSCIGKAKTVTVKDKDGTECEIFKTWNWNGKCRGGFCSFL